MSQATDLVPLPAYQEQRRHVFPSPESLRWFVRTNHDELVRRGALTMPAGRKLINPGPFDQVVVEVGAKKAAASRRTVEAGSV